MVDAVTLAQEITPYMAAAVGAYGAAVLTRAEEQAADATVSLGQRLIRRLTRGTDSGPGTVAGAVDRLAGCLADDDLQVLLRVAVGDALRGDPDLAAEIAAWPRPAAAQATVTITASGSRSVAVQTANGSITTGDSRPAGT